MGSPASVVIVNMVMEDGYGYGYVMVMVMVFNKFSVHLRYLFPYLQCPQLAQQC